MITKTSTEKPSKTGKESNEQPTHSRALTKQKVVLFGPANSGKTSLQKFFWEKKSFDDLQELPPTKSYEYSDEPLKFGSLEISSLDLGGQTGLIDQWLDKGASFQCFEHSKAVIFVVDFSDELLGEGNFLEKMEYVQQLLRMLIAILRVQVLQHQDLDLLIFIHKWDRVVEAKRRETTFRNLITSSLKQIELEENYENVLTENEYNPKFAVLPHKLNFRGFFFTSIKDLRYSPRRYLKMLLPKTEQFHSSCEYVKGKLVKISDFFQLTLIDLNFFDIDSVQVPEDHDYTDIKERTFRTIMHCIDLDAVTYVIVRQEDGVAPMNIFLMKVNPEIYCLLMGRVPEQDKTAQYLLEFKEMVQSIDVVYE